MLIEPSDLDLITDSALKTFDERLAHCDSAKPEAIEREALRLESHLEQLYSLTVVMARREADMAKTAELWQRVVGVCDVFAARLIRLSDQHALGKAAYDHVLDIRGAAEELRALHSP